MSRLTRLLVTICILLEVLVVALAKSYLVLSLSYRDTLSRARSLSQQPFEILSFFVALNGIPLLVLVSLHSAISRKSVLDRHFLMKNGIELSLNSPTFSVNPM